MSDRKVSNIELSAIIKLTEAWCDSWAQFHDTPKITFPYDDMALRHQQILSCLKELERNRAAADTEAKS